MRTLSRSVLRSANDAELDPVETVNEGIIWFLKVDPRRARWMLQQHIPDHRGWCSHQGAAEKFRWPCRLYQCAHDALVQAVPNPRVPTRNTPRRSKVSQYG